MLLYQRNDFGNVWLPTDRLNWGMRVKLLRDSPADCKVLSNVHPKSRAANRGEVCYYIHGMSWLRVARPPISRTRSSAAKSCLCLEPKNLGNIADQSNILQHLCSLECHSGWPENLAWFGVGASCISRWCKTWLGRTNLFFLPLEPHLQLWRCWWLQAAGPIFLACNSGRCFPHLCEPPWESSGSSSNKFFPWLVQKLDPIFALRLALLEQCWLLRFFKSGLYWAFAFSAWRGCTRLKSGSDDSWVQCSPSAWCIHPATDLHKISERGAYHLKA